MAYNSGLPSPAVPGVVLNLSGFSPITGILPVAHTVLYTVPVGKQTIIGAIELYATTTVNPKLFINVNGTPVQFSGLTLNATDRLVDGMARNLPAGAAIESECDANPGCNYIIQVREMSA